MYETTPLKELAERLEGYGSKPEWEVIYFIKNEHDFHLVVRKVGEIEKPELEDLVHKVQYLENDFRILSANKKSSGEWELTIYKEDQGEEREIA